MNNEKSLTANFGARTPTPLAGSAITPRDQLAMIIGIKRTLHVAVDQIVRTPLIVNCGENGWWEDFSTGLAQAFIKMREKFSDVPGYLVQESLHLDMNDEGMTEWGLSHWKKFRSLSQLRTLALRVVAFSLARQALNAKGFSLPKNPDLENAITMVRSELAKQVHCDQAVWESLFDNTQETPCLTFPDAKPS